MTVCHGSRVETSTDAFVEGAWDGTYDDMAMDQGVCMGSGGRIRDGELVLAAPSHTLCIPYGWMTGSLFPIAFHLRWFVPVWI